MCGQCRRNLAIREFNYQPKVFIFDLDLYDPTLFVWVKFKDEWKSKDIIYFDEAFDGDERKVLIEEVLPKLKVKLLGCTPYALALQIN